MFLAKLSILWQNKSVSQKKIVTENLMKSGKNTFHKVFLLTFHIFHHSHK